jgi:hypothetical protein
MTPIAIALSVAPAAAQTTLQALHISPDTTVLLNSRTVTPQQVQCYGFPWSTVLTNFAGIPAGVIGFLQRFEKGQGTQGTRICGSRAERAK